jgi:hypothetical protein
MPVVDAERKIPRRPRSGAAPITLILHTSVRLAVHAARPRISRICRLACTSDPAAPDQSKQGAATNRAKKNRARAGFRSPSHEGGQARRWRTDRPSSGQKENKNKTATAPCGGVPRGASGAVRTGAGMQRARQRQRWEREGAEGKKELGRLGTGTRHAGRQRVRLGTDGIWEPPLTVSEAASATDPESTGPRHRGPRVWPPAAGTCRE